MKKISMLLAMMLLFAGLVSAQSASVEKNMKSAISLLNKNDALALAKFKDVLKEEPQNLRALCEASLLYSQIGNRFVEKEMKAKYYLNAQDLARQAIEVNPSSAHAYHALGVAQERLSRMGGAKEKVSGIAEIKKNAEQAIQLQNNHAGAWHLLGRVHASVANATKAEKLAAGTLFGGLPKDCSNERAIISFRQAIKFQPDRLLYYYDLADLYHTMGKYEDCEKTLNEMLAKTSKTQDDDGIKARGRNLLAQI